MVETVHSIRADNIMVDQFDDEDETMEAPPLAPLPEPPTTVRLSDLNVRLSKSPSPALVRPQREESGAVLTPTIRMPVRRLANSALANTKSGNRLLISPSRKVGPQGPNRLPVGAEPKLIVLRGVHVNVEYAIYDGANFIGRRDDEPIDIDLEDQEPPDRIWTSRKHAVIYFQDQTLEIEDLNSLNGTFVNRNRVAPGHRQPLRINDVIQVGTIQLRVLA
jgi:hypothetical protein